MQGQGAKATSRLNLLLLSRASLGHRLLLSTLLRAASLSSAGAAFSLLPFPAALLRSGGRSGSGLLLGDLSCVGVQLGLEGLQVRAQLGALLGQLARPRKDGLQRPWAGEHLKSHAARCRIPI